MNTVHIKLYDLFRRELNLFDEKAKVFVEAIDEVVSEDVKHEQPVFKSWLKEDFANLGNLIIQGRKESTEIQKEINRLDVKISETKTDTVRWMLAFWFGQIAVIAGVLAWLLKK